MRTLFYSYLFDPIVILLSNFQFTAEDWNFKLKQSHAFAVNVRKKVNDSAIQLTLTE